MLQKCGKFLFLSQTKHLRCQSNRNKKVAITNHATYSILNYKSNHKLYGLSYPYRIVVDNKTFVSNGIVFFCVVQCSLETRIEEVIECHTTQTSNKALRHEALGNLFGLYGGPSLDSENQLQRVTLYFFFKGKLLVKRNVGPSLYFCVFPFLFLARDYEEQRLLAIAYNSLDNKL